MDQSQIWNDAAAQRYDTPGVGMFAPDLLAATVTCLKALAAGGPALEFAIGTGRVAIPLLAAGVPVAGIELSGPMLAQLRTKADATTIPVVIGDMATTRVPGQFTLVYLVYNTIANLLTGAEQAACFRNAARHLAPAGYFVIELWIPQLPPPPPAPQAVVELSMPGYLLVDVFDVPTQQVVSHHVWFDDTGAAQVFQMPHRFILPAELDRMADAAGFDLSHRHADWQGAAFDAASRAHVSVYRLRG